MPAIVPKPVLRWVWPVLLFITLGRTSQAGVHDQIIDLFASMTAALSEEDNAAGFLNAFDPHMPGYADLKRQIRSLVLDYEIASSVDSIRDDGQGVKRSVDLDWYLELTSRTATGPTRSRRQVIHCEVELQGKHWRIVSLIPISFFTDKVE